MEKSLNSNTKRCVDNDNYWPLMEVLEHGMKNLWEAVEGGYNTDMWIIEEIFKTE